ncbi:MAG: YjjG family noncanonical pyrimidine nucleotidase [Clostridiales bacterium]|nr:YjjG family noncanonical pyrimidine nucleotidase [Clostridiales bacterium]
MKTPRYDLVLLDADRTLFDFDRSELEAIRRTLADWGISPDERTVGRYLEINDGLWAACDRGEFPQPRLGRERFARLLDELGRTDADPEQMNRDYLTRLGTLPYLLPGAEALCQRLYPVCRLVIVTNGLTIAQEGRLARSSIRPYISRMYVSEQMGCRKPEPAYFQAVFADLGVDEAQKRRTVLLGDSISSDIRGGAAAGIDTVWLNPAGQRAPAELEITYIADSLEAAGSFILGDSGAEQRG